MEIISRFVLFAILVSAVPAFPIDVSHSLSSRGAVVISRLEGFDFKTQGSNSLELTTLIEGSTWALSGILGLHGTGATNLNRGWGYRGYEGVHARLQVEFPFSTSSSSIRAGWGGGSGAFFSRYRDTDLLFFYPSVCTFVFLDYATTSPRIRIRYLAPFEWYFRKDLTTSFSFGLSIGVVYTWTVLPSKEGR
ncbi:MAG: hypothetical protein N2442_10865 [Spirochaetes bacterium]|nr:hypothetical protein [Spirochaetota bacterium]